MNTKTNEIYQIIWLCWSSRIFLQFFFSLSWNALHVHIHTYTQTHTNTLKANICVEMRSNQSYELFTMIKENDAFSHMMPGLWYFYVYTMAFETKIKTKKFNLLYFTNISFDPVNRIQSNVPQSIWKFWLLCKLSMLRWTFLWNSCYSRFNNDSYMLR